MPAQPKLLKSAVHLAAKQQRISHSSNRVRLQLVRPGERREGRAPLPSPQGVSPPKTKSTMVKRRRNLRSTVETGRQAFSISIMLLEKAHRPRPFQNELQSLRRTAKVLAVPHRERPDYHKVR